MAIVLAAFHSISAIVSALAQNQIPFLVDRFVGGMDVIPAQMY